MDSNSSNNTAEVDSQVFNKNAVKRLATMAGANRTKTEDIQVRVNEISEKWVHDVLEKAVAIMEYAGHKTINVCDIQHLADRFPQLVPQFYTPKAFCPVKCKSLDEIEAVLKGKQQHTCVYTSSRPFSLLVTRTLADISADGMKYRLGQSESNNTVALLQVLLEEYLINIFTRAMRFMGTRPTLSVTDINNALLC